MSKALEEAGPPLWTLQDAAGTREGFPVAWSDFPCKLHGAWQQGQAGQGREGRAGGVVLAAWSAVQVRAVGEERMCRKGGRGAQVPRTGMESNFSLYGPT